MTACTKTWDGIAAYSPLNLKQITKTMKKIVLFVSSICPVIATILLIGCSSVPDKVDSGAIHARTFNFVGGGVPPAAEFADNRQQAHAVIQQALTGNLAGKGLTKVQAGGDVTVAYLVILGNNVSTESINTYFGYGRESSALQDKAHKAYTGNANPNYFQAGTLVVDIIENGTFKLLRRTHVTRPVLSNPSAEVRAAHIHEAVAAALKDLRVASK